MDLLRDCGAFCATTAIFWCDAAHAHQHANQVSPEDRCELRRLNYPSGYRVGLRGEKRGSHPRIVRDALDIDEVKAALDQNFERIQNIMFSRTNHLAATGSGPAEVEDDGYD